MNQCFKMFITELTDFPESVQGKERKNKKKKTEEESSMHLLIFTILAECHVYPKHRHVREEPPLLSVMCRMHDHYLPQHNTMNIAEMVARGGI